MRSGTDVLSRRHKIEKARYNVTNWPEYNKALRQRGDITIWFTEAALAAWHPAKTSGLPHISPKIALVNRARRC
jgi:hypothetical protein